MFYKGIIFDLDNTLYDYNICHNTSLNKVFNFILENSKSVLINDINYIKKIYDEVSQYNKCQLGNTASSHNKSIHFKLLLEKIKLDLSLLSKLNEIYWNTFYSNMKCFENVKEFIIWNKQLGKKIGILTDYETEYQIIKLEKLKLLDLIDNIITSEEIGIEKPSMFMFQTILQKMNILPCEALIIGDNFDKDIKGGINSNILSYWYNPSGFTYVIHDKYFEFNNYTVLYNKFKYIYNELNHLKNISKYCGERYDLVQAGGGNASIKIDDLMFIKSSGINLSNIDVDNGYVLLNNKLINYDILNNNVNDIMKYNIIGNKRASIETFMHSILKKYTLHLHPIQINKFLCLKNSKEICSSIYPRSLIIDYYTPGIKLCNEIKKLYNNENIIFLINHGIIVTSDNIDELYIELEKVISKFERNIEDINFEKYKNTNIISKKIYDVFGIKNITILCEDTIINNYLINKQYLFKENIVFPDALVYCGIKILFDIDFIKYKLNYNEYPKIIIYNNYIYITSNSLSKCKEIEDVLKSCLMILDTTKEKEYLSNEELLYLNNWDSEKYRKIL